MWVKIHSGSKGCTKGAFLPIPLLCTLLCLLWQVLSAYSFPIEQHPYWNKQNISSTWLAPTSQQNHVLPTGSLALGRVFFSLQGDRSGMEEPFEQLGKHRNLKTLFLFLKVTFPCPALGEDGTLPLYPNKQAKRNHGTCPIPSQGAGNTFVLFVFCWDVSPCPAPQSIPVPWQKPAWSDVQSAPHSDLQLGHPVTTHQFCFFSASSTWPLVTKGCFSWRLPAITAAREQGFSEGHQTLGKAQSAGLRLQPRWHFSTQICSFSLPLVSQFCRVNKTRPSFAVILSKVTFAWELSERLWGLPMCSSRVRLLSPSCLKALLGTQLYTGFFLPQTHSKDSAAPALTSGTVNSIPKCGLPARSLCATAVSGSLPNPSASSHLWASLWHTALKESNTYKHHG